jgi:predicted PurR-regulated permease PerM
VTVPQEVSTPRERRALAVLAAAALAAMLWIARPVGLGILLGTLTAFTFEPFYERLNQRFKRPKLAAALCVLIAALGSLSLVGALSSLLLSRGVGLAQKLLVTAAPGGEARLIAERFATNLGPFSLSQEQVNEKLGNTANYVASRSADIAASVAAATFEVLLGLFFAMMTLHYILRHWGAMVLRAEKTLPIRPRYTRALLLEFQRVGRSTLLGTVLTGIGQGVFAGVGYALCGLPEATFFGAATAVASLVPGVGTMLVWGPAGVYLYSTGHPFAATFEILWGSVIVIGLSDYVIRPQMVGGDGDMPSLLTFVALFGGVEVFGLPGLIFGPLIMAVSYAILRLFAADSEMQRREEASLPR